MDGLLQAANEAVQTGIEVSIESLQKSNLQASAEAVKKAAQYLIAYTEELIANNNNLASQAAAMNSGTDIETVYNFSKKLIKTKDEFTELMSRVFDFQNKANAFLGQQVQMMFLYFDKNNKVQMYAVENSVEDLILDRASSKRGGAITGRYKNTKISKMGKLIDNNKAKNTNLESTFDEVYARFKISKQKQKMRGAAYIIWKENGEWDGAWISGAGPLGEAYFNFFVNEYIFSTMIDPAVKDFMTNNKYGAILADKASGFLQGDVGKGSMEYGIKTEAGPSMGYMEIVNFAKKVLEVADVKQYLLNLKQELKSQAGDKSNMVRLLKGKLEEVSEETIKAIEARINKGKS